MLEVYQIKRKPRYFIDLITNGLFAAVDKTRNMEHGTWNMEHGTWNIPEHSGTSRNIEKLP